jgi:hypothetical protein
VASVQDFVERQHERAAQDGRVRIPPQPAESVIP